MKLSNVFAAFVGLACAAPTGTQDKASRQPLELAWSDNIIFPDSPLLVPGNELSAKPLGPGDKLPWVEPSVQSVACRFNKTEQICGSKLFCGLYRSKFSRPDDKFSSIKDCLAARQPAPLPKVVYRGEHRAPEALRQLGGIPTEFDGPTTNKSYSLETHHWGMGQVHSAYTSTTSSFGVAYGYSRKDNAGDGWVYKIHPTPNMIDMDASDFFIYYGIEDEFSALGGVRWDQVEAWMAIPRNATGTEVTVGEIHEYRKEETFMAEFTRMKWIKNEAYNPRYDGFAVSGGQPQLAGNAPNLDKYKEKTLEQWAVDFMEKNGVPVGWTGAFPLNLQAPVKSG
ncbi:hypothetical protein BB8028_0012g00210 [Beauveria bassiana]|uniref:Heat Labile Enterotoxin Type Iib n=1 Tax=Beauveria bassiana TaxID=176275 RepID=A0A2S7YQ82_BEABA|nr:hypothetical protein BB8028_0012g00210 [Beauveria bassiana]